MKGYIKKKSGPNQPGPSYRTPDHFRASRFGRPAQRKGKPAPQIKFNPSTFKIQHKG